jgi:hypothetical protein
MPFVSSIRSTFGAQSKQRRSPAYATISPAVGGVSTFRLNDQTITISTAGEYKFTLADPHTFRARVFGAGGGGGQRGGWTSGYPGGSGGYATGIVTLPAGTHTIIVGEGGSGNTFRTVVGGGHSSQPKTNVSDNRYSACGGGFSGIFSGSGTVHDATGGVGNTTYRTSGVQSRSVLIAGGGGGGGSMTSGYPSMDGGHGGGSEGTGGLSRGSVDNSSRGTQTSAGALRPNEWGGVYQATLMHAGSGGDQGYGGGGGGGYFAGGNADSGSGGTMAGGGGGSGFIHPTLVTSGSTITGSGQTSPGGVSQTGYIAGSGRGGDPSGNTDNNWQGGVGGAGIVIITQV